ncbi:MAG: glycerate kinase, partial [Nitrospirae bacterium]|nr:glycerate kinase [Nitrospirota bacterium]
MFLTCRKDLERVFFDALRAVDPYLATAKRLSDFRDATGKPGGRLNILGFGKASARMAQAAEETLAGLISRSVVVTKYGHSVALKKTEIIEAGHPIPDANGIKGTEKIRAVARASSADDINICLVSGGGSALLVCPLEGISLEEKQEITGLLLNAGADIFELNTVRKHISAVKGGRLAETLYPSRTISLLLSDVIGDRLDVIASGPTAPDETTYLDALNVLKRYNLMDKAPKGVLKIIEDGIEGRVPDTPSPDSKVFSRVENIIIGSNRIALEAARQEAGALGYSAEILTDSLSGEAREAAKWLYREVMKREIRQKACFVSGGETTVVVKGSGLGGRNLEFALVFAMEIAGIEGLSLLSAGTDGTDGPTDAAGAIVDGETIARARAMGLSPEKFLEENDSYNFFKQVGGLFITGPTGTNVMDIQIVIR